MMMKMRKTLANDEFDFRDKIMLTRVSNFVLDLVLSLSRTYLVPFERVNDGLSNDTKIRSIGAKFSVFSLKMQKTSIIENFVIFSQK